MSTKMIFTVMILLIPQMGLSHPVIYKGGTVISSENNSQRNDIHAAYSMTSKWALGLHMIKDSEKELNYVQVGHLIKRWNEVDSQANIYAVLGLGAQRKYVSEKTDVWSSSQAVDLMADWEDRDYYIQAMQRYVYVKDDNEIWHSRLRLGIAPFRSDSEDLGIWGIVQFDKMTDESWTTTNLLRFYYKSALWEIGANLNGSYQLNLMFHL